MTTTKRKTQQDATEPGEQKAIGKAVAKRKPKQEETLPDEPQNVEHKTQSPSLTINIQSWATPIVGILMLVVGALAGFYARPSMLGQLPESAVVDSPASAIPTTDQSAAQQSLMTSVIAKTRHFIGDPNAPVTIIEFGDFQ